MKKVIGALFGLAILCVIGVVAVFMLPAGIGGPAGELAGNAKAAVTNAALDVADVKGKVNSAIDQNKDSIASATGMTAEEVDDALDQLDIDSWQATPLPAEARETGTFSGSYAGVDGSITTYEDPGYVTVEAYGQTVTLEVPASAQEYLARLQSR